MSVTQVTVDPAGGVAGGPALAVGVHCAAAGENESRVPSKATVAARISENLTRLAGSAPGLRRVEVAMTSPLKIDSKKINPGPTYRLASTRGVTSLIIGRAMVNNLSMS